MPNSEEPMWTREDVQRVLFHVVQRYNEAIEFHGGLFDEFLHSAIVDVAIPTLKDNRWWPDDE
jgi:hypothetical protein